jgi:hypothetical protein
MKAIHGGKGKNDRVIERTAPEGTGDINKKAFLEGRAAK